MRFLKKVPAPFAIIGVTLFLTPLMPLITLPVAAQRPTQVSPAGNRERAAISASAITPTPVILRASDEDARRTSTPKMPTKLNPEPQPDFFFPLTPGTWWLYRGTVRWTDSDTNRPAATQASIKM